MCHPHVVGYLHAVRRQGELCIFMEYCEGGTLAQLIRQRKGKQLETEQVQTADPAPGSGPTLER